MRITALLFSHVLLLFSVPLVLAQATFTVTTTADSGSGSLRQAILDANARSGRDFIVFNIPAQQCDGASGVCTISLLRNLPEVTGAVELDGLTQPGADCDVWPPRLLIEISGSEIDEVAQDDPGEALTLTGGSSLVRGLVINRFSAIYIPGVGGTGGRGIALFEQGNNRVECNYIGLTPDGTQAPGIRGSGLTVRSSDNVIGGIGRGNAIGGNDLNLSVGSNDEIRNNRIQGNYVGIRPDGTAMFSGGSGILVTGQNNLVGGTEPGAGNVTTAITLSGNGSRLNKVQGNYVGTTPDGTAGLGSGSISLSSASENLIGGTEPGARNLVLGSISLSNAHDNIVQGNYVGVDRTGMVTFPDRGSFIDALSLSISSGNLIGGSGAGEGNVFVGTFSHGKIRESSDNRILGNRFGTNATGTQDLGKDQFTGVEIAVGSSGNQIGGEEPGAGNIIASARSGALSIERASFENIVLGNFIGTTADGTQPLPSFGPGVVLDSVFHNIIGSPTAPNTIAFQLGDGILVTGGGAGNILSANHIFANGGLGINLEGGTEDSFGVTANDPDGTDDPALPNGLQNYPVLALQAIDGDDVTFTVTLSSRPNTRFRIEIFAANACNASGYGEGARFLMAQDATVSSSGQSTFPLTVDTNEGDNVLTATATGTDGTSEFSACVMLDANAAPTVSTITQPGDGAEVVVGGTAETPLDPSETLMVTWTEASDPNSDALTYRWEVSVEDAFSEVLFAADAGAETTVSVSLGALASVLDEAGVALGESVVLYHRAVASDGASETAGPVAAVTLVRGTLVATEDEAVVPEAFVLEANYPNPFNPQTTIGFALPQTSEVRLVVYDILGREVARLVEETLSAGRHEAVFDAGRLPSGVYLYRLEAEGFVQTRRMLLLK